MIGLTWRCDLCGRTVPGTHDDLHDACEAHGCPCACALTGSVYLDACPPPAGLWEGRLL